MSETKAVKTEPVKYFMHVHASLFLIKPTIYMKSM